MENSYIIFYNQTMFGSQLSDSVWHSIVRTYSFWQA